MKRNKKEVRHEGYVIVGQHGRIIAFTFDNPKGGSLCDTTLTNAEAKKLKTRIFAATLTYPPITQRDDTRNIFTQRILR